jgi:hypothetical protein
MINIYLRIGGCVSKLFYLRIGGGGCGEPMFPYLRIGGGVGNLGSPPLLGKHTW